MEFRTLVADPPWPYSNKEGPRAAPEHRPNSWNGTSGCVSSALRYGAMSIAELAALPVQRHVAANAHCYLWTTNSFLEEAHHLLRAWGFVKKTMLTWGKMKTDGTPSMKAGYYYRGATEHVLFGVRGVGRLLGPPAPTLFLSPRLPHSVKPPWFYDVVNTQSPGPVLEMFARERRDGWTCIGNSIDGNDIIQSLSNLEIA